MPTVSRPRRLVLIIATAACALAPAAAASADIAAPLQLTRTYQGADASAFATRAVGTTVVGFSEAHRAQRAFVFKGTRQGTEIVGRYWTVAKGAANASGPLTLAWSDGGSKLTRAGGDDVGPESWTAKDPSQITWPKERDALFQSTLAGDLDGAFAGTDGSRAYVGQHGSEVAFLAERFVTPNAVRPAYASVVIGQRSANGALTATYYDLPKGTTQLRHGPLVGQVGSSPRRFTVQQTDGPTALPLPRASSYTADYAIDVERFAQEIVERETPFTVGFSFAIGQDGAVVKSGAGGSRRAITPENGVTEALPFEPGTVNEVASTSKTVTLVAVLRALRERGISVDSPVSPWLPASWGRGLGMETVTFRQLLSHGLQPQPGQGLFKPGGCSTDPYNCLKGAVETGLTEAPGYDNIHYTIFRVILPFVVDPEGMAELFASETDEGAINEAFSSAFRAEVRDLLLDAGVLADFAYEPWASPAYNYQWGPPLDEVFVPVDSESDYLTAGSGGLKMSAPEFARFLTKLERGSLIGAADLADAKAIGFGGTGPMTGPGAVGPVWGKNGGAHSAASQAMVYPGTEVFLTRNSTGHPTQISDSQMLTAAWTASLIGPGA